MDVKKENAEEVTIKATEPCLSCGAELDAPDGLNACRVGPCPCCGYPKPWGDCE